MWPILSNIPEKIATKIKSNKNQHKASELNAWIRVFSGAKYDGKNGLILESNTDYKLFKAAGESVASIYGSSQGSGVIGLDWDSNPVETGSGRVMRPSPVITGLTTKEGKDQISREATLNITVFSLQQMEKMQTYFMEPGYSLYIEWGWNTDDGVKKITKIQDKGKKKSPTEIVQDIANKSLNWADLHETRTASNGEFDCFLGFIVGSSISNEGENFNITVNLRGAPSLPTYLQGTQGSMKLDANGKVAESNKVKNLFGPTDTGGPATATANRRFARMFNDLPSFRQINQVYALKDKVKFNQFINFDDYISKAVLNGLDDGNIFMASEDKI